MTDGPSQGISRRVEASRGVGHVGDHGPRQRSEGRRAQCHRIRRWPARLPTPPAIVEAAIAARRTRRTTATRRRRAFLSSARQSRQDEARFRLRRLSVAGVVTNGGKHAVYATCQVLLDPGDEVLLPAPYWVSYPEAISLAGG